MRLPPLGLECEILPPNSITRDYPYNANIKDYTLKKSLPPLSPEALLSILEDNSQQDQPTEEWSQHIKTWINLNRKLNQTIQLSNPGTNLITIKPLPESTINSTTSKIPTDNATIHSHHHCDDIHPIAKEISKIVSSIFAVIIYRSIIRICIQYPIIVNKQSNHPYTTTQLKMRETQCEYHHLLPKIIPHESLA